MVTGQNYRRNAQTTHLLHEKLQDPVGDAGVIEHVTHDEQRVTPQLGHARHYG
jgi:hypothetical protein